jgi:hypothetical protein
MRSGRLDGVERDYFFPRIEAAGDSNSEQVFQPAVEARPRL